MRTREVPEMVYRRRKERRRMYKVELNNGIGAVVMLSVAV
jgi:hypothetical protein